MRVLMISTDKNILEEGTAVRERMISYGTICDELHIVLIQKSEFKNTPVVRLSENVFIYQTNFSYKIYSLCEAYRIGVGILTKNYKLKATGWLVTSQDPFETGLVSWCISKKTKAKLQLQIHTDFLSPYFKNESFLNRIRVVIAKFLLPRADGIRVVSLRIASSLKANSYKLKATLTVLPIFVDVEKIRKTDVVIDLHKRYPQFDFIFLMASRLTREKNIGVAVEAMGRVINKYPNGGLVIVGSGPEEINLKLKAKSYNLEANVFFEPWQSEIISYYKTADAFLLPSNYEGFGMTLVEAAASLCPIISSDVGIVGDIFLKDKDILVCDSGDVDCFAKNMEQFINYPEVRKEYATSARMAVQDVCGQKEEYLKKIQESWR